MIPAHYAQLQETVYRTVLPNGLTVMVLPRPGFTKKLAYFGTDFGAIHTEFELEGKQYQVPAGVAHYLEHKMFDLPGRDVSAEFAALGAVVNAFTSYDITAYYFSCTEHFEQNLKLLLEFVSTPYFTEESVEKERGIIDQEIGMNADSPDSQIFERLMPALFENHPVQIPILGTSDTIREITPEVLDICHRGFYNPKNMILCVVGDVQPETVERIAEQMLPKDEMPVAKKRKSWPETMDRPWQTVTGQMEVAMPMFQMGFRCESAPDGMESVRQEVVGDLAAEALFGESSPLYLRLYEEGLIDSSFGGGFECLDGCSMLLCGGDSDCPEEVCDAILAEAERIAAEGIEEEDFLRMKRSALGRRIRELDSFDSTCFRLCAYYLSGVDYFCFPEVYRQVQRQEIQEFLAEVARANRGAVSVLYPISQEVDYE